MLLLEILLLAVVQGVAEFLPVSSSGHVVVGAALCDQFGCPIHEKLTLNIVLHLGTLLAVVVFAWDRVCLLLTSDRRVVGLVIAGTLPAAAVGVGLKVLLPGLLENPLLAGCMFLVTGVGLLWTLRLPVGTLRCRDMTYRQAMTIGLAQALAILPGISRSGATIVAGLAAGLKRGEAAAFSFLLAIPAIGGAGLIEILQLIHSPARQAPLWQLALGSLLSFAVGLVALRWLVDWLHRGRLYVFAFWVLLLGPLVIAWQLAAGNAPVPGDEPPLDLLQAGAYN